MSAVDQLLNDLDAGLTIGTDNRTAARYGTNKIPDLVYKLRKRGYAINTHMKVVTHRGVSKRVAEYSL